MVVKYISHEIEMKWILRKKNTFVCLLSPFADLVCCISGAWQKGPVPYIQKGFCPIYIYIYGTGPFLYPTSILLIKRQVPVVHSYNILTCSNIKFIPKTNATMKSVTHILGHSVVLCTKTNISCSCLIQIYAYFIEMQGFVKPRVNAWCYICMISEHAIIMTYKIILSFLINTLGNILIDIFMWNVSSHVKCILIFLIVPNAEEFWLFCYNFLMTTNKTSILEINEIIWMITLKVIMNAGFML